MLEENAVSQPKKELIGSAITQNILFLKTKDILMSQGQNLYCDIIDGSFIENENKIEKIREIYKRSVVEEGVVGFSDKIDKMFDPYSYYFVSGNNNEILSFVRMVFKTAKNRLPLEYGKIKLIGGSHIIQETQAVELTTFWAKDFYAFEYLARKAIEFVYNMGVKKVFSTKGYGERNLKSVYKRLGLIKGAVPMENIYYDDYGRVCDNSEFKPIIWEIFEGNRQRIEYLMSKISQARAND